MSLLILFPDRDPNSLVGRLKALEPALDIQVWPDVARPAAVTFAVSWNHTAGSLGHLPNLKAVMSYGAGVDHLWADPQFPTEVQVSRVYDEDLTREMGEYAVMAVLNNRRNWDRFRLLQRKGVWSSEPNQPGRHVGIMGLGNLGAYTATLFTSLGYRVSGWSRSPKNLANVNCFHGSKGLNSMVAEVDYLVCLLPLTKETSGLLNFRLFDKMKSSAYLINMARGGLLLETDLIGALDSGCIDGACLDVFQTEPLPGDHPFWSHPKITITPHVAGVTNPDSVARQILDNYTRVLRGDSVWPCVDPKRGY